MWTQCRRGIRVKHYVLHPKAASEPTWSEAWWWLGIPIATAVAIFAIYIVSPEFYRARMLPEGYGILELSHFFIPLAGFFICLSLFSTIPVKSWPLLRMAIVVFAISCFYIAGEEHSWGQWFFYWDTPELWGRINRQNETNLHNTFVLFNQLPQNILRMAIVIGGIILPLSSRARRFVARYPIIVALTPPAAIVPVAVTAIVFSGIVTIQKSGLVDEILARPSEAAETFYYMFILFYLIMLRRRLRHQQADVVVPRS